MDPLPIILGIASIAGAIGQASGKVYIDDQWLEDHFGSKAYAVQFKQYLDTIQSSPEGQKMLNEAHTLGQQMANDIRANATAAGFGGAEGVQSGGSLFATSVADQATNNLRRQVNAQMSQVAAQQAQDYLNRKMAAMTSDQGRLSQRGAIWGGIGQAAGVGLNAGWGATSGDGKLTYEQQLAADQARLDKMNQDIARANSNIKPNVTSTAQQSSGKPTSSIGTTPGQSGGNKAELMPKIDLSGVNTTPRSYEDSYNRGGSLVTRLGIRRR